MDAKRVKRTSYAAEGTNDILQTLVEYRWRWIIPAVLVAAGVAAFALTSKDTWEVSQSIIVRNHAVSDGVGPGEFHGVDPMRRAVDTIVEVCLSSRVLGNALAKVGPPADETADAENWPDDKAIQSLREVVSIEAPNGAEFGTTEVFFIKVQDNRRDRALALVEAIYNELNERSCELRDRRAGDMVAEVEKMVAMAETDLQGTTQQIKEIEQSVGGDVVGLRMLHASPGGNAEQEESLVVVDQEIMQLDCENAVSQHLVELLESARDNPQMLLAAPPDLLDSHPLLQQLILGLAKAKLKTAGLRKNLSEKYPTVRAAIGEETAVRECILSELNNTIQLIEADVDLKTSRRHVLAEKQAQMSGRLEKLASMRAEYSNLVNIVAHRQKALETAEQRLTEVRIRQAVARSSHIISRLDSPEIGYQPIGPSRAMTVLAGILGGLMTGFGFVALTVVGQPPKDKSSLNGHAVPDIITTSAHTYSLDDMRSPVLMDECESVTVSR